MKKIIDNIFLIIVIVAFIPISIYWIYVFNGHKKLKHDYKCTVSTLIGWQYPKGGRVLEFGFYINGKFYRRTTNYDRAWNFKFGEKYWAKYLPNDPNIAELIRDEKGVIIMVTDSLVPPKICICKGIDFKN